MRSSAVEAAPDITTAIAACACSRIQVTPSGPAILVAGASRSTSRAIGAPSIVSSRSTVTPAADGSTTYRPSDADTTIRSASRPAGTQTFSPVSFPSDDAAVEGVAASPTASESAAVMIRAPAATPSNASSASNCTSAGAASPITASAGIGAAVRPTSSSTMHDSRNPSPAPPADSGIEMPTIPASASVAHRSRSKPSSSASTRFTRSSAVASVRILAASSRRSCWSEVKEKSISGQPSGGPA